MTRRGRDDVATSGGAAGALGLGVLALYAAFLLLQATLSPRWQWDVLAYVGCALESRARDPVHLAEWTYAEVRAAVGDECFAELREGLPYRREVAGDPESFRQQLGFYRGRVLFVGAMRALGALGVAPAKAAVAVSALAAVLCALLLFRWLSPAIGGPAAAIATCLLGNAAGLPAVAASPTPDALAAALVLAGLLALFDRGRPWLAWTLFALAVATRADAVFVAGAALVAEAFWATANSGARRRRVLRAALASGALLALVLAIQRLSGAPPYRVLLRHTFLGYLARPEEASGVGWAEWGGYLARSLPQFSEPRLALVLLLGGLGWLAGRASLGARAAALPAAVVLALFARYAVFPALWERLLVPHTLAAGVAAVSGLAIHPTRRSRAG